MVRLCVYEYVTAVGLGGDPASPEHSLYREGYAMWQALREDFAGIAGIELVDDWTAADAVLPIAPESGGILAELSAAIDRRGQWRIGPSLETIRLTSDKLALAEHWQRHGVPTPPTRPGEPTPDDPYPVVWKPRDGCGSQSTYLIHDYGQYEHYRQLKEVPSPDAAAMIVQPLVWGRAASVAFLCGPNQLWALPPCWQHLSDDGRFRYLGGSLPLPQPLARRAVRLARQAIDCLSGLCGYVGVDLVLGAADDGSADYAIEVNPRMTTSYIGLRKAAVGNLAAVLWQIARGEPPAAWEWLDQPVHFSPQTAAVSDSESTPKLR